MFHLFTLQGQRIDLPLENLKSELKVNRTEKPSRPRKHIEDRIREPEHYPREQSSPNREAVEAYRDSGRMVNIKEKIYYVSEIMNSPVISISPDMTAADVWKKFDESGVRHMPVLSDEGKIKGILSERDLFKKLILKNIKIDEAKDITVRDIMSHEIIATGPETDIRRVARAMLEQDIGLMPVVDKENNLIAVVTRSDILHAIIHHPGLSLWA